MAATRVTQQGSDGQTVNVQGGEDVQGGDLKSITSQPALDETLSPVLRMTPDDITANPCPEVTATVQFYQKLLRLPKRTTF